MAGFPNVASACAPDPGLVDLVVAQLDQLRASSLRALLNVEGIFFEPGPTAPSSPERGPPLVLRSDYLARWNALVEAADLVSREGELAAAFVADEPTWRGVAPAPLESAYEAVRATLPTVPLLRIEAHPVLARRVVPTVVDRVAFDRYGVADPGSDPAYPADLATLEARRSRPGQRLLPVMETRWFPAYGAPGLPAEAMGDVAASCFALARRNPLVAGLIGYLWPSGLDAPDPLGARDLPASVRAVYESIGRQVLAPGGG